MRDIREDQVDVEMWLAFCIGCGVVIWSLVFGRKDWSMLLDKLLKVFVAEPAAICMGVSTGRRGVVAALGCSVVC